MPIQVRLAKGTPEFGAAFYRTAAGAMKDYGKQKLSDYFLKRSTRAFENPLPKFKDVRTGKTPGVITNVPGFGNRWDYGADGAQFKNVHGVYNPGDSSNRGPTNISQVANARSSATRSLVQRPAPQAPTPLRWSPSGIRGVGTRGRR